VVVEHHARLSPFVGVGAGHTGPVGIGKDGERGGWLVLGVERWCCGLLGYKKLELYTAVVPVLFSVSVFTRYQIQPVSVFSVSILGV